jgi:hypothetical protein
MWAVYIPHNSFWDRLRGESLCERVGTLRGDGRSVLGVTTPEVMSHWRYIVCELLSVISFVSIGAWDSSRLYLMIQQGMGVGRPLEAQLEAQLEACLKIAAKSASAEMVSSPTRANGTSG